METPELLPLGASMSPNGAVELGLTVPHTGSPGGLEPLSFTLDLLLDLEAGPPPCDLRRLAALLAPSLL